ncbi:uncharacterized protein [Triticum aestivum]|uniref:uncharacterized protein isoform X3 n=1 Tax=Triticum aestivum TaxID=4565 RepID=UPI001D00832B|nr:uncharacterized protein LOC123046349 isoform X3 [Triticum aestivum]
MTKLFSTLLWVLMVPLSRFIGMAIREGTSSCGWTIGLLTKPSELILTIHRYCNLMVGVSPQKCKLQRIWINSFELFCSEKVLWVKIRLYFLGSMAAAPNQTTTSAGVLCNLGHRRQVRPPPPLKATPPHHHQRRYYTKWNLRRCQENKYRGMSVKLKTPFNGAVYDACDEIQDLFLYIAVISGLLSHAPVVIHVSSVNFWRTCEYLMYIQSVHSPERGWRRAERGCVLSFLR